MKYLEKLYDELYDSIASVGTLLLLLTITACVKSVQLALNLPTKSTDTIMIVCIIISSIILTFIVLPTWLKICKIKSRRKKKIKEIYGDE